MKNETLFGYFRDFVFEIYPFIDPTLNKTFIKPRYDKYPSLRFKENGMPELSEYNSAAPYKIFEIFRDSGNGIYIEIENLESYNKLLTYLINLKEFRNSFYSEDNVYKDQIDKHIDSLSFVYIIDILERYYLLNTSKLENEELLLSIYNPFENFIYFTIFNFDISVPILFLQFEEDYFQISENIILRKIEDNYHKSRFNIRSYSPPIADSVLNSATHELVFKNYYIENLKRFNDYRLENENVYPLQRFEMFFNAIKISTNHNSGFAQILVYPQDWVENYNLDLPPLKGTSLKKYPNYFDYYYWNNNSFPVITIDQLKRISFIFNQLILSENNKIQISNKRLRSSYLRDNEEDSILDIIIALETLLGDNGRGEVTHKLALRTAKLISMHNKDYDAIHVFKAVKEIYAFRSMVVHGSHKIDSKREIKLHQKSEPISIISLANDFLREIIGILIDNPKFLDSHEIDKLLLS